MSWVASYRVNIKKNIFFSKEYLLFKKSKYMHIFLTVSHIRPNEALHANELLQLNPSVNGDTKNKSLSKVMNPWLNFN